MSNVLATKRTRCYFMQEEIEILADFVESQPKAGYAMIEADTGVARRQIIAFIGRRWFERDPALRMKDFIKKIRPEVEAYREYRKNQTA